MAPLWFGLQSCLSADPAPEAPPPPATATAVPTPAPTALPTPAAPSAAAGPSPAAAALAVLDRVAVGPLASDVRDVRSMLQAQDYEARGDFGAAANAWFEALHLAQGRFGKLAMDGWLKAYTQHLGKRSDPAVLARLVMAETQNGGISPYMRQHGLTTDAAMEPELKAVVPRWLTDTQAPSAPPAAETLPPAERGIPESDPLLTKSAGRACESHQNVLDAWRLWLASLAPEVREYWSGLVSQACGKANDALDQLALAYPKLAKNPATAGLALEAAGRVAALQRANDLRAAAASTYMDIMALWTQPGVTAKALGLEPVPFALRRIDETLWSARYRAMVADYENGKILAQQALSLIGNAHTLRHATRAQKEQLAGFTAEAYHALAFRIAVEKKEFESAAALTVLALQTPDLPRDWQEKLAWYAGLYNYLAGHFESAQNRWEALLRHTHDELMRPALYFWLAKAAEKLGHRDAAKDRLVSLLDEYPLSFYATVAPTQAGISGAPSWQATFGDPAVLVARLGEHRDFGLSRLRNSHDLRLALSRAEILTVAEAGELASAAVDELEVAMSTELPIESNAGPYVYLSRLEYRSGAYLKTIGLTTRLSRVVKDFWRTWPEQVLVYYPRPYLDDFKRNALGDGLDAALLLAISRQESGFTPNARSGANAVGLMQLIHPTGLRFAEELGLDSSDIDQTLRNPVANIRIGSRFLRYLSLKFDHFPPAVYGGYNAGEYAISSWLKRRAHSDPLMFVELVPFAETRDYIKSVWRNVVVYNQLANVPDIVPALELSAQPGTPKAPPAGEH